jgi:TonB family protein
MVAAFGLLRYKPWAGGLTLGLALLSIFWHFFELSRGSDLELFGSYGERGLHEELVAVIVLLAVFLSSAATVLMLIMRQTRTTLALSSWRTSLGLSGAMLTGLVITAMAVSELRVVSALNQRPIPEQLTHAVTGSVPDEVTPALTENVRDEVTSPVIGKEQEDPPIPLSEALAQQFLRIQTQPANPESAKKSKISGEVVVAVLVIKDGSVEDAKVVSGHPLLTRTAVETVRTWKFRPFLLNGEPVRFKSKVRVLFMYPSNEN